MSKYCPVTGKGPVTGNNRSHSLRATRRRWNVNLQKRKIVVDGEVIVIKMSNRAYRTLNKSVKAAPEAEAK
ncbi:MAG: 50S ribosomal protein L28 [Bacilli bacterium]|nr:50S ribosomal protein L28 [Bacilli bacterium]